MKGKITQILLVAICTFMAAANLVSAQTPTHRQPIPLILKETVDNNPSGHLWAWYGIGLPLKKLTTWPYNNQPVMSPDGKWVAYTWPSQSFMDYQGTDFGAVPMDMWLLDLSIGKAEIIGGQPTGNVFDDKGQFIAYTTRSHYPVWSPDGKMLTWVELVCDLRVTPTGDEDESNYHHLIVYDIEKRQATTSVRIESSGRNHPEPFWSDTGIAVQSFNYSPDDGIRIFSPAGKLLFDLRLDFTVPGWYEDDHNNDYLPIEEEDSDPNTNDAKWVLLNPTTGKRLDFPKTLEIYNSAAPTGLKVLSTGTPYVDFARQIIEPGKPPIDIPTSGDYEISPDGQQVVYQTDTRTLFVYSNGKTTEINTEFSVQGLTWGSTILRIPRTP